MSDFYRNIKDNDFQKVSVYYTKGGVNYFSSNVVRRGIYIYFSEVKKEGHFERTEVFANNSYKILAKELKRASQKQFNNVVEWVENNQETLFNLHKENKKQELFNLITENF